MKTKITIDIECTPGELRQFMGYPDLQGMHERLTMEIEQRFRDAVDKFSPEAALQQWFGAWPSGLEPLRSALERMMTKNQSDQ
jgi:hypothetical protein